MTNSPITPVTLELSDAFKGDHATLTAAHKAFVTWLVKSPIVVQKQLTHVKIAMIHALLGLAGELGELEEAIASIAHARWHMQDMLLHHVTNLLEEVGDFAFYATDLRQVLCLPDFKQWTRADLDMSNYYPAVGLGHVVDRCKKHIIYGAELTDTQLEAITDHLDQVESYYAIVLEAEGATRDDALAANLHKLNTRYPDGYTDEAARLRADKNKTA